MAGQGKLGTVVGILLFGGMAACAAAPNAPQADPGSTRAVGAAKFVGATGRYQNQQWLGLRYAKAERFHAPQLVTPAGRQDALAFGAACPQLGHPFGISEAKPGAPVGDEDCLFLDVYAPKLASAQVADANLPVMVWFHGGGNVVGHGAGYDGGNLAQRERVIVVTANYRLGPFGWFRHAALREGASPEDASGNFGLLDQMAALRWVQQHVAAFGGNPANVTIFGESAGARDVLALLVAPAARGLFARAIAESGGIRVSAPVKAEAYASDGGAANSSNEILARLWVRDGKAADQAAARAALAQQKPAELAQYLRGKPAFELITAYANEASEGMPDVPNVFNDGVVMPSEPTIALLARAETRAQVPVMLGTNRDEAKTFMFGDPTYVKRFTPLYMRVRDPERYAARAQAMSLAWKVTGADAPAAAITQSGGEAYVYRFDWDEEPTLLGNDVAFMIGAGHGFEIPFVFGHFHLSASGDRLFTPETKDSRTSLAQQMMGYWAEFARSGRPGKGHGQAGAAWTPFRPDAGQPTFMVFDTKQGGGVRIESGALSMDDVFASIEKDARLNEPHERCAVTRDVARSSALLDASQAAARVTAACKDEPAAASK